MEWGKGSYCSSRALEDCTCTTGGGAGGRGVPGDVHTNLHTHTRAHVPELHILWNSHITQPHSHTHARTIARMHAHTHTHTHTRMHRQ